MASTDEDGVRASESGSLTRVVARHTIWYAPGVHGALTQGLPRQELLP
jgi:hypothetical protein